MVISGALRGVNEFFGVERKHHDGTYPIDPGGDMTRGGKIGRIPPTEDSPKQPKRSTPPETPPEEQGPQPYYGV